MVLILWCIISHVGGRHYIDPCQAMGNVGLNDATGYVGLDTLLLITFVSRM